MNKYTVTYEDENGVEKTKVVEIKEDFGLAAYVTAREQLSQECVILKVEKQE